MGAHPDTPGARSASRSLLRRVALGMLLAACGVRGHAAPVSEYAVKLAFIHDIALFTRWPATAPKPMTLCVLGRDPFGPYVGALDGKLVDGLPWRVVDARADDDLGACRVLFIAGSQAERVRAIVERVAARPVLTVGDTDGFAAQGVMVNFYLLDNRVRFEVNVDALARARLFMGSQLLKLARIVHGAPS